MANLIYISIIRLCPYPPIFLGGHILVDQKSYHMSYDGELLQPATGD